VIPSSRATSSHAVTATPHTASAATPPRSTLPHVKRRRVPVDGAAWAPFALVAVDVDLVDSV
jgi:hypothetical protein